MGGLLDEANQIAVDLAGSEWVYLAVLAFAAIDAFFPPIPSESIVVALAAIGQAKDEPSLVLLAVAAALGAFIGDNIAFRLGRIIGTDRFAWMRKPRMERAFLWARVELDQRAALLILTARYIPVGRVAVNMTAGATGFPYRRFLPLASLGAVTWATYSVAIGMIAGNWAKENPLAGAAVAIVIAVTLGLCIDRGLAWWRGRRTPADPA